MSHEVDETEPDMVVDQEYLEDEGASSNYRQGRGS